VAVLIRLVEAGNTCTTRRELPTEDEATGVEFGFGLLNILFILNKS